MADRRLKRVQAYPQPNPFLVARERRGVARRLGRLGLLALGFLLLLAPSAAAVPYLQAGADAARTGLTNDPGPATGDTAFTSTLPGRLAGTPLIFDGAVFVATFASPWLDDAAPGMNTSAVWKIDLATGQRDILVAFEPSNARVSGLASDGRLLFTNVDREFRAYDAKTGAFVWSYTHKSLTVAPAAEALCRDAAVHNGTVYAVCYQRGADGVPATGSTIDEPPASNVRQFAISLDAATGRPRWTWVQDVSAEHRVPPGTAAVSSEASGWAGNIAVIGDQPYVVTMNPTRVLSQEKNPTTYSAHGTIWALDDHDGSERWRWGEIVAPRGPAYGIPFYNLPITGDEHQVLVGSYHLMVLDPEDGDWFIGPSLQETGGDLGRAVGPWAIGMPLALQQEALWVGTMHSLHRLDPMTRQATWAANVARGPVASDGDERSTVLISHDRVFVDANPGTMSDTASVLTAVSKDGTVAWQAEMGDVSAEASRDMEAGDTNGAAGAIQPERHLTTGNFALGEGVLAYVTSDGKLQVFGRTEASIAIDMATGTLFPALGKTVSVDLSGTRAGVFGPATQYRVVWGDGAESPWQTGPRFEHSYLKAGDVTAIVRAKNAAGQTASETITFHVGATPPAAARSPTLLSALTARENQDFNFGMLGIFLTAVGGTVAYARYRRHGIAGIPLATEDRTEAYRAALDRAIDGDGKLDIKYEPMLLSLRAKLGLTERDHAILLAAARADRGKGGLLLTPGATVLGKYRIVEQLGAGGQGTAYRAQDTVLGREVVVKVLATGHGDDAVILREARTLAALRHPNVVTIFDVDRLGDAVFLVMERVEGGSLKDRLRKGALERPAFLSLAADLLSALGAVHEAGMLHLDVKPANVLLTSEGQAKLADFGIAQRPGLVETIAAVQPTTHGSGTVAYMAPEQARAQPVTRRSDLYAAGLVLFEAWTGRAYVSTQPGEGAFEVQMRVAAARPFHAGLRAPSPLKDWFARALHPDAAQRFDTAVQMLDALPSEVLLHKAKTP